MKNVRVIAGIGLALLLWMGAAQAQACGGFVSNGNTNVQQRKLNAAIIHDGKGRETLVLLLEFEVNKGSVQDFGWIMPLPANPDVAPAPENFFTRLDNVTKPKKSYLQTLTDSLDTKNLTSDTLRVGSGAPGSAAGGGVNVVSQTRVGAFAVTVVAATDQAALQSWADQNGFNISSLATAAVRDYISKGWFFALAKLATDQPGNVGKAQPIALTFDAPEPLYPWRLAAYNPQGQIANRNLNTEIYTLKPNDKLTTTLAQNNLSLSYAEHLNDQASQTLLAGINGTMAKNYFLTKYSGSLRADLIAANDLKFSSSGNSDELNSGNLSGLEWLWAVLLTLFYAPILIFSLINIWILLGVSAILIAIVVFTPLRYRRYMAGAIALLAFLSVSIITCLFVFNVKDVPPLVLVSLLPLALLPLLIFLFPRRQTT